MSKKNLIKICLDIVMILLWAFLYNKTAINLAFHEVIGLVVFGLLIIHLVLNKQWITNVYKRLFSKGIPLKTRISAVLNVLLLIDVLAIIISGVLISKVLFSFNISGMMGRTIHYAGAGIGLIIIGLHIGLHWRFIGNMIGNYLQIPKKARKTTAMVITCIVCLFGAYSMATTNFTRLITMPFTVSSMQKPANMPTDGSRPDFSNGNGAGHDFQKGNGHGFGQHNGQGQGFGQHNGQGQGFGKGNGKFSVKTLLTTIGSFFSIFYIFACFGALIDHFGLSKRKK